MAQFADITITRTGLDMIAKSQTGDKLIFTGIKIGDGQIGAQSIPDMTDLINFKQDVPINSVTAKENGHAEIIGIIDNENLDVGFFVREIGIYAKINEGGTPARRHSTGMLMREILPAISRINPFPWTPSNSRLTSSSEIRKTCPSHRINRSFT